MSSAVFEAVQKGGINHTLPAVNDEYRISATCWKAQVAYACSVNAFMYTIVYNAAYVYLPVVLHKAVTEVVSKIGNL